MDNRSWPDRKGEYYALCPFHDDTHVGSFSFSVRGYKCFACDAKGSLAHLARLTGEAFDDTLPVPTVAPKPAWEPPSWHKLDLKVFQPIPPDVFSYLRNRGLTERTIRDARLGFGQLPLSSCHHGRIILPIFEEGSLVALKGREVTCDCPKKKKWTFAKGSKTCLFNADALQYARGRILIVTEAPFSALLAMQDDPSVVAVAPSVGGNSWEDEWAQRISSFKPKHVYVWYDNDLTGNDASHRVAYSIGHAYDYAHVSMVYWGPEWPDKADLADYRKGNDIRLGLYNAVRLRERFVHGAAYR
jgi:DNA primase